MTKIDRRAIAIPAVLVAGAALWLFWPDSPASRLKPGSFAVLRDGKNPEVVIRLGRPHEIIPDSEAMEWIAAGTRVLVVSDDDPPQFPSFPDSRDVLVNVKEGPKAGITGHLPRKHVIPE